MKIKDGYLLKKMLGKYMIFSASPDNGSNAVHTLNETGAFLWDHVSKGLGKNELVEKLLDEYDVDRETAQKDVDAFLSRLQSLNILSE